MACAQFDGLQETSFWEEAGWEHLTKVPDLPLLSYRPLQLAGQLTLMPCRTWPWALTPRVRRSRMP